MEYRILGKTGLNVSRMGFGGIPIQRIDAEGTKVLMLVNCLYYRTEECEEKLAELIKTMKSEIAEIKKQAKNA